MTGTRTTEHPYGRTYGGSATENYERFFVPVIGAPLARDLIAAANLRPGKRVLDVACGTGIVARLAAESVGASGSVTAIDINEGMLNVARSLAPPDGAPIRWFETTAESMPLPDNAFDAVLCQLGLMFIADRRAALREMHRVAVPGARVLVSVPTPTGFFDVLDTALARHIPAAAGFVRMVFSMHDEREIEELFRGAGFRNISIRSETKAIHLPAARDFLWQYVHSTPLVALTANADESVRAAIEHDVVQAWQPWVRDGELTYDQGVIVTTARK